MKASLPVEKKKKAEKPTKFFYLDGRIHASDERTLEYASQIRSLKVALTKYRKSLKGKVRTKEHTEKIESMAVEIDQLVREAKKYRSEHTFPIVAEGMTKEDLIDHIHKSKCSMLKGLNFEKMSKGDILLHLIRSKCPELHSLLEENLNQAWNRNKNPEEKPIKDVYLLDKKIESTPENLKRAQINREEDEFLESLRNKKFVQEIIEETEESPMKGKVYTYNKKFYDSIDKMFSISGKRHSKTVRGTEVEKELFDNIWSIQKNFDLYPTPKECIEHIKNDFKKLLKAYNEGRYYDTSYEVKVLEPSAGTGAIVRDIIDMNGITLFKNFDGKDVKLVIERLDAVEMTMDLSKLLKKETNIDNVYQENFLKADIGKNDYNLIIMNPPYSHGSEKGAYLYHLLRAMYLLSLNKNEYGYLYIIIPTTYMDKYFIDRGYGRDKKVEIGNSIPFEFNIGIPNINKVAKEAGLTIEEKRDKDDDDTIEEFNYAEITKIAECDTFASLDKNGVAKPLGVKTGIYRIENIR